MNPFPTTSTPAAVFTAPAAPSDLRQIELESLARRAAVESRRFYRHEAYEPAYAYELFRRALVERDQAAWGLLYELYAPLVDHWVRRTGAFTVSGETSDYFVCSAFTRFWRAIPPTRFEAFPTLAALLNYLRRCATCVVIDTARAQSYADILPEEAVNWNDQRLGYADEEATDRVSHAELWAIVEGLLVNEAEQVLVRGSFLLGLKPSEIFARWPHLFSGVEEVYSLKRAVLARLRKSPELRELA
ncbi:MAG: sigma-70 family RNA polymerase sigma factor [Oscillochloridaceae bacterium umkhey_bin13]